MSNEPSLERAFELIQQGKDCVAVDATWEAAAAFDQAREILQQLATAVSEDGSDEEQAKIAALYQQQSREYLVQARASLLEAMQQEHETDRDARNAATAEPTYLSLSDEDAGTRLRLFARLFARELQLLTTTVEGETQQQKPVLEQQSSLEDRLNQLNASLPSGFKTSNQRMQDINKGLNRLGLSLYSAADAQSSLDLPAASESDQVADIIQQAKDEIAMQPVTSSGVNSNSNKHNNGGDGGTEEIDGDALLLMNEEDEDDDDASADSDDLKNEMDIEDVQAIREKVVDAQAKLAEIIALLDVDEGDTDGAGHCNIPNQGPAKKALRSARVLLQQATRQWAEC
jgi:hypothetical protein